MLKVNSKIKDKNQVKIKINGGGQECPPYICTLSHQQAAVYV
jgi:hypothetical protein